MKKIKFSLMTLAVLISIGGALASRPGNFGTLYYWTGTTYMPAGTLGVNYVCTSSTSVCTYTLSGGVYTPFQTASTYTPVGLTTAATKPEPKQEK